MLAGAVNGDSGMLTVASVEPVSAADVGRRCVIARHIMRWGFRRQPGKWFVR